MPKERSDNRRRSREIYNEHNGQISNREIARILECSEKSISGWKCKDNWTGKERSTPNKNKRSTPKGRKRGGQPGNKNATGPPGNQNARKHGLFSKWLPEEINNIIGEMPSDPLDILWHNIELQYANIIHSQQILYVKDKSDKTEETTFAGEKGVGFEIQKAWDKQASNLSALSRATKTLESMIKQYDEMLHKNWDTASEIQKAQLAQIRAQTDKLTGQNQEIEDTSETDEAIYGDNEKENDSV